jgi:methyl-accepting chemotaxis protein
MKRIRSSITAQATATFAVLSVVVVASFAVMTVTAGNLRSDDQQRSGSTRAIVAGNQLEQAVLDLETGLRGYLLAGRPAFLQPYRSALGRYPGVARSLQVATAGDPQAHRLTLSINAAVKL